MKAGLFRWNSHFIFCTSLTSHAVHMMWFLPPFLLQLCICITSSMALESSHTHVHVVPHSHVDPMWLFTSSEYSQRTQLILESTILALLLDETKTFVWDSVFFLDIFFAQEGSRSICSPLSTKLIFSAEAMNSYRNQYRCMSFKEGFGVLLQRKQIELVGGGWVSHDEALTDFSSAVSNMALGRSWIVQSLGEE